MFFRTTSFNSEDSQSELSVLIVLLSLIRRSLPSYDFFRTSSPWKLETFTQNFWSSGFFGAWSSETGTVHQNFMSQSLQKLLANLQNFLTLDDLLIRATSSEFALNVLLLVLCNF